MFIDEETRQRIVHAKHIGDITYNRTGNTAVSQESIPLIGPWEDYTGSDININSRSQQHFAGAENELQGQDAAIKNKEKLPQLNVVGQAKKTVRRRIIKAYKKLDGKNN